MINNKFKKLILVFKDKQNLNNKISLKLIKNKMLINFNLRKI